MGYAIRKNSSIAIKEEVTEGTYVAPAAAAEFIRTTIDGITMEPSRETLERDLIGGSIGKMTPRNGMKGVTGNIVVEAKAHGTEGTAPEFGLLVESALGTARAGVTKTTSDSEGGSYSTTVLCFDAADIAQFAVGDIIMVKVSGDYHISPITTVGTNEVTLLIAAANPFVDGLTVAAFKTYLPADSGHKAISISKYIEDAVVEKAIGCKVNAMSLENFTTGQVASLNFGFEGLDEERAVSARGFTPEYDAALPPIVLEACVFQDGVAVPVNEFSFSLENTLGFITSTCNENGKIASRVTSRAISGSFNPYKQNDSVAQWTKFDGRTEFSLFVNAKIPTGVTGEYEDVFGIYMPKCSLNNIGEADQDGVLQETLEFVASTGTADADKEIYISFI